MLFWVPFFFFFSCENLTFYEVFKIKWSKFPKTSLPVEFNRSNYYLKILLQRKSLNPRPHPGFIFPQAMVIKYWHTSHEVYETRYAIWYHSCNLKNAKHLWRSATFIKVADRNLKITLLRGFFSRSLNCTNGTKSRKASHIKCSVITATDFLI